MRGTFYLSIFLLLPAIQALSEGKTAWEGADNFLYQLQNIELTRVASTAYDLIVMDYSSDGTESGEWTTEQIEFLRSSGEGKIVLAYISIGEAEDYRFYWDASWGEDRFPDSDSPAWLGSENPGWPGNFKVKYWNAEWQDLILAYLDRIIRQGFDGVYLDIVDGYWYWAEEAAAGGENEQLNSSREAANRMVAFMEAIARHCRVVRAKRDFIICQQNGSGLPGEMDPEKLGDYWRIIDGIGAEDTFFYGPRDEDNRYNPQRATIRNLEEYVARGKKVLATEYLTQRDKEAVDRAYALCEGYNFVPFVTTRELDVLRINQGHEPD
jgi:cysteinyl-tRNA synthetase